MTLFYLPLEKVAGRYTESWSRAKTGWIERVLIKEKIDYVRIDGDQSEKERVIKTGAVLDAVGRCQFTFSQISQLLTLAEEGKVTSGDVIFLDDFWSPGFSALPYVFSQLQISPRIYVFLHAQSCDYFDFTFSMRQWMRHFEKGEGEVVNGIFVCGHGLRDEVILGGIAPASKVHAVGHPFCSEEVMERMPEWYQKAMSGDGPMPTRFNKVVWASRWDAEKNPMFFLEVAKQVIKQKPETRFVICCGGPALRSNGPGMVEEAYKVCQLFPKNIILRVGLKKEEYYAELATAKISFNSANQDWNSIAWQEASVAGTYFCYPYFRAWPRDSFLHQNEYMYCHLDLHDAVQHVIKALDRDDLWTVEAIKSRSWMHKRFDVSWKRMLVLMGYDFNMPRNPYDCSDEAIKYWCEQ